MKIPHFAEMLVMPPKAEVKTRAKRGANPKSKPGPKTGAKAAAAASTLSHPDGAPPMVRNWRVGEYKPDLAMREAVARARAEQPRMMSLAGGMLPPEAAKE